MARLAASDEVFADGHHKKSLPDILDQMCTAHCKTSTYILYGARLHAICHSSNVVNFDIPETLISFVLQKLC